ncbi:MAG: hypothetical protein JSR67_00600 [Proteobacteria bacterium]|nr:hypothetical protein [Pseudomonadota bacterium]
MSVARLRLLLVLGCLLLPLLQPAVARMHDPEKLAVTHIRDLHYGDVLFYFYQDRDFEALTRLLAYDQWQRFPHEADEAHLLAGGLYLSLGMHNEAGERFQALLNNEVPTGVRNRAWFYLAQVWYARGYLDRALGALQKINGRMSPNMEAQRELLTGNVLIHQGHFDEAIQLLSRWRGGAVWSAYARFNLGVALVRSQRLPEASQFLTAVGTMEADSAEMEALRDRANLALGFAQLQANQPREARVALARVRLNGPYSNRALLGTGWADAALGDYHGALAPWMELRSRNVLDAAVQESFLAVPYAFGKLNANAQSATYYENAVSSFDAENARLDAAIVRLRRGELLANVLRNDEDTRHGWFWQLHQLPDAPESRYLYTIMAGHDFQEGLKNYRDLDYLSGMLGHWDESMDAFADMIDTRERAYAERLPRADALLASGAVEHLQEREVALENELSDIRARHDVAALGTAEERDQWARTQRLEGALATTTDSPDAAGLHERLGLLKGVQYYRLDEAFGARLWQAQRGLKDIGVALREAQSRWIRVQRARKNVPLNNGEFAARIAALRQRIGALQTRLAAAQQRQGAYLAGIAVGELQQQKERLAAYQVQARYALADMYDRAAHGAAPRPAASGPQQKGSDAPEAAPAADAPRPPAPEPASAPAPQPAPELPR